MNLARRSTDDVFTGRTATSLPGSLLSATDAKNAVSRALGVFLPDPEFDGPDSSDGDEEEEQEDDACPAADEDV